MKHLPIVIARRTNALHQTGYSTTVPLADDFRGIG